MKRASIALGALAAFSFTIAAAGTSDPWWVPKLRNKQAAPTDAQAAGQEVPNNPAPAPQAPGPGTAPAAAATATAAGATPPPPTPMPNSSLLKLSGYLRQGPVGTEPNAVAYLDLIDHGRASAAQVNDFAAYLAKRGMPKIAMQYQEYATDLAPKDGTIWLNLGTIQRTMGSLGPAAGSFKKAISIDPNNALAHYNLGAVYDAEKSYDDAIEEYRRALVLEPDLADPRKNPQVVNNENLLAVRLTIYGNQAGALGLPLLQMQKTPPATKPAAPPATPPAAPPAAAPPGKQ
jgi:tetratricopeptide (TPR) repeat protein